MNVVSPHAYCSHVTAFPSHERNTDIYVFLESRLLPCNTQYALRFAVFLSFFSFFLSRNDVTKMFGKKFKQMSLFVYKLIDTSKVFKNSSSARIVSVSH